MIVALPLPDPDDAVIVALPTDTPVTTPLEDTTATEASLVDHDTEATIAFPFASRGVAVSVVVHPTFTEADDGETVTLAMDAAATFTVTTPLCPSLVAVTVVLPTPVAVIRPLEFTVAMFVLPLDHVMARPVSGFPLASRGVAVTLCVPPTVRLTVDGETETEATGTGGGGPGVVTVTMDVPL